MKKILVSLLVLALCAPAMAATVTVNDNADGTGTIVIDATAEGLIVGLGLNIDTTGGNITALSIDPATFNIYPDAAHDLEVAVPGSYTYGDGTPIADQDAAGETALSSSFAVSVGMLNGEAIAGAAGAAVVTINVTVDADANICVEENAIRGGIVLTDGTGVDIDGTTVCGDITDGPGECVKSTAGFYATWELFGKPDCWCYPRNCRGDTNNLKTGLGVNKKWVNSADLVVFADAFNLIEADLNALSVGGVPGICADNDRAKSGIGANKKWVNSVDLAEFADYFNLIEADVTVCDMTNYNFFINP